MSGTLRVGTAGWSYPDWKGVVYPRRTTERFDPLRYLAAHFDMIEINSTFYRAPEPRHAERWAETVDGLDGFRFTAKLQKPFSHVAPGEWKREEVAAFREGMQPLVDADRLGALLVQFPFWFDARPENLDHLKQIQDTFQLAPLVVEVRHRSFLDRGVLDLFRSRELSFCNIDQPRSQTSIEPGSRVTGPIGYLRLHGRNGDAWFRKGAGRDEKYDYLYSPGELKAFVPLIRELLGQTSQTYVVANNHYLGKGPVNALELKGLFGGLPVEVPPSLLETYPRLTVLTTGADVTGDA